MELYPIQATAWPLFLPTQFLFPAYASAAPENYVHWTQTPESHLYTADLPGVRKEEIRVEVEDSRYLVIRTEWPDDEDDDAGDGDGDGEGGRQPRRRRRFMRKFRLPRLVDLDGISAGYEDGVLTVTVPRSFVRERLRINTADVPEERNFVARAA